MDQFIAIKQALAIAEADALREDGKWQQAADAAQMLAEEYPQHADAWALMALALPHIHMVDAAEQAANTSLTLDSQNPIALRALAIINLRQGNLEAAKTHADQTVKLAPQCARSLMTLAGVYMAQNSLNKANELFRQAMEIEPLAEIHANYAILEMRRGNIQSAIKYAEKAVEIKPFLTNVWQLLVGLYRQIKCDELSVKALEQMIRYEPDNPAALSDLGEYYRKAGRIEKALGVLERAVAGSPAFVNAWINYGSVLCEANRSGDAIAAYHKALALNENQVEAHNNLGVIYIRRGELEKALAAFEIASKLRPERIDIRANLGGTLAQLGRIEEAEAVLAPILGRKEWKISDSAKASILQCMITVQIAKGNVTRALELSILSLKIKETEEGKSAFAQSIKRVKFVSENPDSRHFLVHAISDAWARPKDLVEPAISLIKLNELIANGTAQAVSAWPSRLPADKLYVDSELESISTDELLLCVLENVPVSDVGLEKFLTMARYAMLEGISKAEISPEIPSEAILRYYCALSRQCFINEYVYGHTAYELTQANALRERLIVALASNAYISPLWLIGVAAYYPLMTLPGIEALIGGHWPDAVSNLLSQQVQEPLEEKQLRATIPSLTSVKHDVSLIVQQQYEENPYPRWVKSPIPSRTIGVDDAIRGKFPLSSFVPLGKNNEVDILIAGCGTGQHPIGTGSQFRGARVLAIDLSFSSLSYAKRKTIEAGISSIEYARADIMELGRLERRFDLIEAVGVLHHLADPLAGWRMLVSLLHPGGLMRLGLYSELGRQNVVEARTIIASLNCSASEGDIRAFRQYMIAEGSALSFFDLTKSDDFFTISSCRDLLFHCQEHRFNLSNMKDYLKDLKLNLIGFILEPYVLNKYISCFPDDKAMTNLDNWDAFEIENPRTFAGMYQFWVQKSD